MVKTTAPLGNGHEANVRKVGVAVLFPVSAAIWVPVKSKNQWTDRVTHALPGRRPTVAWEAHPGRSASKLTLNVSLAESRGFRTRHKYASAAFAAAMEAGAELSSSKIA